MIFNAIWLVIIWTVSIKYGNGECTLALIFTFGYIVDVLDRLTHICWVHKNNK